VTPDGSGYASREMPELIKTNHPAFRPIDVKMGPDGAIYIADWYNPIIQHGEVDFRDPRRDHVHGRIWRVTAKGRPLVPRPKLVGATTEELLEQLKAPEDWTRHFAKRELKERGKVKVEPALAAWLKKLNPADKEYEHHLLEALWTYQSLNVVEPKLLDTLLHARDPRARAGAVRVVQHWQDRLDHPLDLVAERVADDHPQVRLEAVRVLSHFPAVRAAEIAMRALDRPVDRFLDYALGLTARELGPQWLPEFQKGKVDFGNAQHLLFALQAVNSPAAVGPLLDLVQAGKIEPEREEAACHLVATLGNAKDLARVFELTLDEKTPARRRINLLACLEQASRQRQVKPEGDLNRVGEILKSKGGAQALRREPDPICTSACRLVGLWKIESHRKALQELIGPNNHNSLVRQAALEGLIQLDAEAARRVIEPLAKESFREDMHLPAIIALASLDARAAARPAVEYLSDIRITPSLKIDQYESDVTDIFRAFMQRKNGITALANAVKERAEIAPNQKTKKLPPDVAKVGIRTVRATSKEADGLVEALKQAAGLETMSHALSTDEMKQMIAEVAKHGDPVRGEVIYRRKDMVCQKCHALAGAGGQVGPDLTGIGASAQVDYIIESILLPSKAIKENYHSLNIATKDGRLISGIPVRQTERELVLRDADDREITIPAKDIEAKEQGGSLMPEGLADMLTRSELVDLVRFLSELGKVGQYSPSKARVVRRWKVLEMNSHAWGRLASTLFDAAAGDDPLFVWSPAYSTLAGSLPTDELPRFSAHGNWNDTVFLRFELDVSTAGKVKVLLNSKQALIPNLWVDGGKVDVQDAVLLNLNEGLHTITLAVQPHPRTDPPRIELADIPGSPARVRIVNGK
jgi:putative heme-binding domain-containing protein